MLRTTMYLVVLTSFILCAFSTLVAQNERVQRHPQVIWELKHDLSPRLGSLPVYHGNRNAKHEAEPVRRIPIPASAVETATSAMVDSAIQRSVTTPLSATANMDSR